MTCIEFKGAIKDYLEGKLPENRRSEFSEHLLNCQYCRREIGENIADIISGNKDQVKKGTSRIAIISFVVFILCIFLAIISLQYIKLREYAGGEISPITEETKRRLSQQQEKMKAERAATKSDPNEPGDIHSEIEERDTGEDFSQYSGSELLARLAECRTENNHKCISAASLYLARKSEGSERRKYRLSAIEALVEQTACSAAMLQIMLLFKENPEIDEINLAHFLNAKCYVREKNYRDAEKILRMIEKDAPALKKNIAELREEIKKGEKYGSKTKPEGIQNRDSP